MRPLQPEDYEALAELTVETDSGQVKRIAERIVEALGELPH